MTPKEKAEELHIEYWHLTNDARLAKQCALIAVDDVIKVFWHTHKNEIEYKFWKEVKIEIERILQ